MPGDAPQQHLIPTVLRRQSTVIGEQPQENEDSQLSSESHETSTQPRERPFNPALSSTPAEEQQPMPFGDGSGNIVSIPRPHAVTIVNLHREAKQALAKIPIGPHFFLTLRAHNQCGSPGWTLPQLDDSVPPWHTHVAVRSSYRSILGMNIVQHFLFPMEEYNRLQFLFVVFQYRLEGLPAGDALTFAIYGNFHTNQGTTVYTTFTIQTTVVH